MTNSVKSGCSVIPRWTMTNIIPNKAFWLCMGNRNQKEP